MYSRGSSRAGSRAGSGPSSPTSKEQAVLEYFGRQKGRRTVQCMSAGGSTLFTVFGLFVVAIFVTDLSFFVGLEEEAAVGWDGESKFEWLPPERGSTSYVEVRVDRWRGRTHRE